MTVTLALGPIPNSFDSYLTLFKLKLPYIFELHRLRTKQPLEQIILFLSINLNY